MGKFACRTKAEIRKRTEPKSYKTEAGKEARNKVYIEMKQLAKDFKTGKDEKGNIVFKNIKDLKYNNMELFESIYKQYTGKEMDPDMHPTLLSDVRKFRRGLELFNLTLSKPEGYIGAALKLPRTMLSKIPELRQFDREITIETGHFKDFNRETSRMVNDFISTFKELGLSLGEKTVTIKSLDSAGINTLRKVQGEYSNLQKRISVERDFIKRGELIKRLNQNRSKMQRFYEEGSGRAFKYMDEVLQGGDPYSIEGISSNQRQQLVKIKKTYQSIREQSATELIRGLEKVKQMAKDKDIIWVDGVVEKINGLIKGIELQKLVDDAGNMIDVKDLRKLGGLSSLGFAKDSMSDKQYIRKDNYGNRQIAFSKHYMSQYTLGLLKTINNPDYGLIKSVENNQLSVDKRLMNEINQWDGIIKEAKGRSPLRNPVYDLDPYFFLKSYTHDVGMFNYRVHVKSSFKKAADGIINEHLNPAKELNNRDVIVAAESHLKLLEDVYQSINSIDPGNAKDPFFNNMMRALQSVTYFRLMGGNVRSAARNATQRLYEYTQFGFAGWREARNFYKSDANATANSDMVNRALKKYGYQWFNNKDLKSNAFESFKGRNETVSDASRGALTDSYMNNKILFVNKNGELSVKDADRIDAVVARKASDLATFTGGMHRVVEDWNRAGTFRTAFALAYQNIFSGNRDWIARQMLKKERASIKKEKGQDYVITYKDLQAKYGVESKVENAIQSWTENKAGRIAYNSVLDLHFEYANWAKSKALKVKGDENGVVQLAKMGLGQFAHYRFNMFDLMQRWVRESGRSIMAGDLRSEEALRPLRFGILQAVLWGGSIATGINVKKLASNDVMQTGEAMWVWMSSKREDLLEGEISEETAEKLDKVTFGKGGFTFLGPNIDYVLSAYELFTKMNLDAEHDIRNEFIFDESQRILEQDVKMDENQENYDFWHKINSQAARFRAYTIPQLSGGASLLDAAQLELGFYLDKDQRDMRKWGMEKLGFRKSKLKNPYKKKRKTKSKAILDALDLL